jgi:hypothetical protein
LSDEEDVALSVFQSICRGAAEGRLKDLSNRDELWWLLLRLTKQKVTDHTRRELAEKRGGGTVRSEADFYGSPSEGFASIEFLISREPTPDFVVMLEEQQQHLLGLLRNDQLRIIAIGRIEGKTTAELAEQLALTTRSIERKLQLIRNTWASELMHG